MKLLSILLMATALVASACATTSARRPTDSRRSTIRDVALDSVAIGGTRKYTVYLPPGYAAKPEAAGYPVLYALHGLGGQGEDWLSPDKGDLRRTLDRLIRGAEIRPLVVVMPNGGDGYWTNHLHGDKARYADYVTEEVIPDVERRFKVARVGSRRGIIGVSMGGHGAMSIGLQHPERFAAVASLAGALFVEPPTHREIYKRVWGVPADQAHWDKTSPIALMGRLSPDAAPALYIECGDDDGYGFLAYALRAHEILTQRQIAHQLRVNDGGHTWRPWRNASADWLRFFDKHLK